MAEEQDSSTQASKSGTEPTAIKGLSVPPPPQALAQPLEEGYRVPTPSPQIVHERMGQPVPLPARVLMQPAATTQPAAQPDGGQPASSGQSPQSAPSPTPAAASNSGSNE